MSAINIDPKDLKSLAQDIDLALNSMDKVIKTPDNTRYIDILNFSVPSGGTVVQQHGLGVVPYKTFTSLANPSIITLTNTTTSVSAYNSSGFTVDFNLIVIR